jgi:hypothetical protein
VTPRAIAQLRLAIARLKAARAHLYEAYLAEDSTAACMMDLERAAMNLQIAHLGRLLRSSARPQVAAHAEAVQP